MWCRITCTIFILNVDSLKAVINEYWQHIHLLSIVKQKVDNAARCRSVFFCKLKLKVPMHNKAPLQNFATFCHFGKYQRLCTHWHEYNFRSVQSLYIRECYYLFQCFKRDPCQLIYNSSVNFLFSNQLCAHKCSSPLWFTYMFIERATYLRSGWFICIGFVIIHAILKDSRILRYNLQKIVDVPNHSIGNFHSLKYYPVFWRAKWQWHRNVWGWRK